MTKFVSETPFVNTGIVQIRFFLCRDVGLCCYAVLLQGVSQIRLDVYDWSKGREEKRRRTARLTIRSNLDAKRGSKETCVSSDGSK